MTLRLLCGLLLIILSGSIIWAFKSAPFWASFDLITENPWGKVTLIDLYSGFVAFAIIIGLVDGPWIGLIAFLLLCVLGNVVSLAWLAFHGFTYLLDLIDKSLAAAQ
jgi:hypothetical protein